MLYSNKRPVRNSQSPRLIEVIGAIGVSGNTPQEDEDIAKVGAAALAVAIQGESK